MIMAFPFLPLFCFLFFFSALHANATFKACNEREKHALLSFKHALIDPENHLSSWSADHPDCCLWNGVRCHNVTGQVVELDLQFFSLGGKVSPALLRLEFLNHLDLSLNDFGGAPIPSFLGSMGSLRYLDLSAASFGGLIPHNLGNLSNLVFLFLSGPEGYYLDSKSPPPLFVENLDWISHLSSLEFLSMSAVDLHKEVGWLQLVSSLPSLSELHLVGCGLDKMSPSLNHVNFTSLSVLDLSFNNFNHEIPKWLFNLNSSLEVLYLNGNSLKGLIPDRIGELRFLADLMLDDNQLIGQIPEGLGKLQNLQGLSLQNNALHGPLPSSLGNLSSLQSFDIGRNKLDATFPSNILGFLPNLEYLFINNNPLLEGIVLGAHLKELSNLKRLDMSSTSLMLKVKSNWVPSFQLEDLSMGSCKMGPDFPRWLKTQTSLQHLDISNSGIRDVAPTWLWEWASHSEWIDLSGNEISGNLSGALINSSYIYLNSNRFTGHLPALSPTVFGLNMANNSFSGDISQFLCQSLNRTSLLKLLDLSNNELHGQLPHHHQCWESWSSLTHLRFGNNHLSGVIPDFIGCLPLKALHLQNNGFSGSVPSSLRNCTSLGLLDLSGNQLSGIIPNWIAELTSLKALSLGSNKLTGKIPSQICQLASLIILDLSDNELLGVIPRCLHNFSLMTEIDTPDDLLDDLVYSSYELESLDLSTVGRDLEYRQILKYVRMIDFSSNNFSGSIPSEISLLVGLRFLNLSDNHLMGSIPEKIGGMRSLLSLDLSRNNLSGEIPPSLANLTFLNWLNLSYNQLQGSIPSSTQLQSFGAFSYIGNAQLRGPLLTQNGRTEESPTTAHGSTEDNDDDVGVRLWFYSATPCGFAVGFLGVLYFIFVLDRNRRLPFFR